MMTNQMERDMTDNDRAKLLDRIRKLLALSTSSNENEAAAAAEKAQALLAEHNLSMFDVKASDGDDMMKDIIIDNTIVTSSHPWRRPLGSAVAQLYFCTYYYTTRRGSSVNIHSFVGADHNVMVAVMMFKYLLETIDRLAQQGARQVPKSEQSPYRVAFRSACTVRLCARIRDRINAAKRGEIKGEGGNALVLASLYDRTKIVLDQFIDKRVGPMRTAKSKLQTLIHAKGGTEGFAAGNTIGLDDQVAGAGKHARIGR
jgi:ElaB/YqjD/DUF883 family membrane-anchored ribosome-binding protein